MTVALTSGPDNQTGRDRAGVPGEAVRVAGKVVDSNSNGNEYVNVAPQTAKCLRIQITLRSTRIFELDHPVTPEMGDPTVWGPAHEAAYGRTFDELVRQGNLHDPTVKPSFAIVDCPAPVPELRVARGWRAELGDSD